MKKVKAGFEIITKETEKEMLQEMERVARTCYKSEDKITDDSCYNFIKGIIKRGHEAMIEFSNITVKFTCDRGVSHEIVRHRLASYAQESTRYCLAGDSKLKTLNPHNNLTIKELYDNKLKSKNGSWKRIKIEQLNEKTGELIYSNIEDIFENGVKDIYEIKTSLGYSLKCTSDHQIYTPLGYKKLSELNEGDFIYINGKEIEENKLYTDKDWLYYQNITLNKTFVDISKEFGYNISTLKKWARKLGIPKKGKGYFNLGRTPWNKGIKESEDERVHRMSDSLRKFHHCGRRKDSILKKDTKAYQKYNSGICKICGSKENLEVHHKNSNRENNNPENLITLCESCHLRVHSKNLLIIHPDTIISINKIGSETVYDISMKSEFHNFVANGVVVHNCNYSKDKYNNQVSFIDIKGGIDLDLAMNSALNNRTLNKDKINDIINEWEEACKDAEKHYLNLSKLGASPNIARGVLPNSVKTEINVRMDIREWRHFFSLRCEDVAHPQMREIAKPLLKEMAKRYPIFFKDLADKLL